MAEGFLAKRKRKVKGFPLTAGSSNPSTPSSIAAPTSSSPFYDPSASSSSLSLSSQQQQQQQHQEAPFLTHLTRHHGALTLTAPDNMGKRSKGKGKDKKGGGKKQVNPEIAAAVMNIGYPVSSSSSAASRPGTSLGTAQSQLLPSPMNSSTSVASLEIRPSSENAVRLNQIRTPTPTSTSTSTSRPVSPEIAILSRPSHSRSTNSLPTLSTTPNAVLTGARAGIPSNQSSSAVTMAAANMTRPGNARASASNASVSGLNDANSTAGQFSRRTNVWDGINDPEEGADLPPPFPIGDPPPPSSSGAPSTYFAPGSALSGDGDQGSGEPRPPDPGGEVVDGWIVTVEGVRIPRPHSPPPAYIQPPSSPPLETQPVVTTATTTQLPTAEPTSPQETVDDDGSLQSDSDETQPNERYVENSEEARLWDEDRLRGLSIEERVRRLEVRRRLRIRERRMLEIRMEEDERRGRDESSGQGPGGGGEESVRGQVQSVTPVAEVVSSPTTPSTSIHQALTLVTTLITPAGPSQPIPTPTPHETNTLDADLPTKTSSVETPDTDKLGSSVSAENASDDGQEWHETRDEFEPSVPASSVPSVFDRHTTEQYLSPPSKQPIHRLLGSRTSDGPTSASPSPSPDPHPKLTTSSFQESLISRRQSLKQLSLHPERSGPSLFESFKIDGFRSPLADSFQAPDSGPSDHGVMTDGATGVGVGDGADESDDDGKSSFEVEGISANILEVEEAEEEEAERVQPIGGPSKPPVAPRFPSSSPAASSGKAETGASPRQQLGDKDQPPAQSSTLARLESLLATRSLWMHRFGAEDHDADDRTPNRTSTLPGVGSSRPPSMAATSVDDEPLTAEGGALARLPSTTANIDRLMKRGTLIRRKEALERALQRERERDEREAEESEREQIRREKGKAKEEDVDRRDLGENADDTVALKPTRSIYGREPPPPPPSRKPTHLRNSVSLGSAGEMHTAAPAMFDSQSNRMPPYHAATSPTSGEGAPSSRLDRPRPPSISGPPRPHPLLTYIPSSERASLPPPLEPTRPSVDTSDSTRTPSVSSSGGVRSLISRFEPSSPVTSPIVPTIPNLPQHPPRRPPPPPPTNNGHRRVYSAEPSTPFGQNGNGSGPSPSRFAAIGPVGAPRREMMVLQEEPTFSEEPALPSSSTDVLDNETTVPEAGENFVPNLRRDSTIYRPRPRGPRPMSMSIRSPPGNYSHDQAGAQPQILTSPRLQTPSALADDSVSFTPAAHRTEAPIQPTDTLIDVSDTSDPLPDSHPSPSTEPASAPASTSSAVVPEQSRGDEPRVGTVQEPRRAPSFAYTDLDLLVSRIGDGQGDGTNYDDLNLLSEILGPAVSSAAPQSVIESLPVGRVEVQRRRTDSQGRVKIRLAVAGIRCNKCPICLTQFKGEDLAVLLPPCLHIFHVDCIRTWLRKARFCPTCRSEVVET